MSTAQGDRASSPHSRSRPLSRATPNQSFSALPPEPVQSVHSSPGATTIGLSHTTNSPPIPIDNSNFQQSGAANTPQDSILLSSSYTSFGTSPTPSVILTHHHHDHAKASSAPTSPTQRALPSPPASLGPASSNEPSALSRLLHQRADPRGDETPPKESPRRWWSRSPSNERSVSPSRGTSLPFLKRRFRDSAPRLASSSLLISAEHEPPSPLPLSSSLPNTSTLSYAPLSNELLSLSREDLQIRDLDDKNIVDEDGDGRNGDSLLLSSPEVTPALVSPTSSITEHMNMNPHTLRSRGIGIEESERKDDIEHSYWPKLLRMSPKSPSPELVPSASESEVNPQVEETPPHTSFTVSPGKGKAREITQDEASTQSLSLPKPPESWYDKFTHRPSAKGREKEKEGKEMDSSWLQARENVSLALNAVLSDSELAQLSESGKAFAMEGRVARSTTVTGTGTGKEAEGSPGSEKEKGAANESTENKVGTNQKTWLTVKSAVLTVSPVLRTSLTILGDVAKLTPIPGLHEAARTLLAVWDAVDVVETNRLQCLRLAARCAMAIYSVRAEIADAERDMAAEESQFGNAGIVGLAQEVHGPVMKLNECIEMVHKFLLKLNRRPFIKRFLRSDEIQQEIHACDKALGDAMQMFSISIQIRILKECKRFAMERRIDAGHQAQAQGQGLTPPPIYASPPQTVPISLDRTPRVGIAALPEPCDILPAAPGLSKIPPAQDLDSPLPLPLAPLQSVQSQTNSTVPISPLAELQHLHIAENASDREQDRELFHSTLQRIISARRDDEVLQVLGVRPGEVPEALKAFRRAEEALRDATEKQEGDIFEDGLKRVCVETGIEAMTRLSSVAVKKAEDKDVDVPWDLPPWTITRYEADRLEMIGRGSFSKVYLGSWSGRRVAIKVLSSHTSASLFRKEVEIWRQLKHENVLRMWGASSAQGERPWFIVSEYCSGGSLVSWLKQRKGSGGALTPPGTGARGDIDLLRCMHHISKGMVYLHDQNVLHEDLKASNVLVDGEGRCVISDFGQSEMKWEASRRSRKPIANGTLRWQAPELLDGAVNLSKATDVYAFAICCVEILGMGDLPYGHRDDTRVAFLVLEQNKRAEIPSTGITSLVEPLIQECWVRDPVQRPAFTHIAATLKRLRKHQGEVESPIPVQAEQLWPGQTSTSTSSEPPRQSPSSYSPGLPATSPSNESDTSLGEEFNTASAGDTESCGSQPRPFRPIGGPCSNPSHRWEPTVNPDTGNVEMPESRYSGIAIYTPSRKLSLAESLSDSMSSASSHFTSSPETEHRVLEEVRHRRQSHHALGYESSVPMDEQLAERRNELRFRSLAQSNHRFHHSLTLPLWSPSRVELGAVGYLSAPKGEFITLFNAMKPQRTAGSKVTNIPSLNGYLEGPIATGKKFISMRTMTQRGIELISGLLTFPLTDRDETYSERISRRHSFSLRAGHKAAYIYAESTMYRYIEDLAAPREWFKANVKAIVKEYAPHHPIQKEDIILVFGTLCAPEYALFVSHSHPNGQAHFNIFSDRESGRPWGTFTTDAEYPSDEGGPSYIEEIPRKAVFASKVSPVRMNVNAKSNDKDKDWDALVLARLRFPTDATEPTSQ